MSKTGLAIIVLGIAILASGLLGASYVLSIYTYAIGPTGPTSVTVFASTIFAGIAGTPTGCGGSLVSNATLALGQGTYGTITLGSGSSGLGATPSACIAVTFPTPMLPAGATVTDVTLSVQHYETGTGCTTAYGQGGALVGQIAGQPGTTNSPTTISGSPATLTLDIFAASSTWSSAVFAKTISSWFLTGGPCKGFAGSFALQAFYSAPSSGSTSGPAAAFSFSPNPASPGTSVQFNAGTSTDSTGTIQTYIWRFGDGSSSVQGVSVSHTFSTASVYSVNLTVTDNNGLSSSVASPVTISAVPCYTCTASGSSSTSATPVTGASGALAYSNDYYGFIDQPLGIPARPDLNLLRTIMFIVAAAFVVTGLVVWRRKDDA